MKPENKITEDNLIQMLKNLPEHEAPEGLGFEIMGRIREVDKSFIEKIKDLMGYQMTVTLTPLKAICFTVLLLISFAFVQTRQMNNTPAMKENVTPLERPDSHIFNYFTGRGLLAKGEFGQSIQYLRQAVALNPENTEYQFWLGVNYGAINDFENERSSYEKVLSKDPEYLMANYYLGHTYMNQKNWGKALQSYDQVLSLNAEFDPALFNKGLALVKLNQKQNAIDTWKEYLSHNRVGSRALKAAAYLNTSGDFTYRIHQIGRRKIVLKSAFKTDESNILQISNKDLDRLTTVVDQSPGMVLHVIVYSNENAEMAENSANNLKIRLLNHSPTIDHQRIRISWFGQGQTLQYKNKSYVLEESIQFIGIENETINTGVSA